MCLTGNVVSRKQTENSTLVVGGRRLRRRHRRRKEGCPHQWGSPLRAGEKYRKERRPRRGIAGAVSGMGRSLSTFFRQWEAVLGAIGCGRWRKGSLRTQDSGPVTGPPPCAELPFAPCLRHGKKTAGNLFPEDLRPELIGEITHQGCFPPVTRHIPSGACLRRGLKQQGGGLYGIRNEAVFSAMDTLKRAKA